MNQNVKYSEGNTKKNSHYMLKLISSESYKIQELKESIVRNNEQEQLLEKSS